MAVTLLALLAIAQADPTVELSRARECVAALDFACADKVLAGLRARSKELSQETAREVWALGAEVALSMERWTEAEESLIQLLMRDVSFLPKEGAWPPRWLSVLEAARARLPDKEPPRIGEITTPPRIVEGAPLEIAVEISDDRAVTEASLSVHGVPQLELPMRADGERYVASVPGERVLAPSMLIEVRASDAAGNLSAPKAATLAVEEPERASFWIWGAVGAAVVGAGVALTVALSQPDDTGVAVARVAWPTR